MANKISRRDFLKLSGMTLAASAFSRFDLLNLDVSAPVIYHGTRKFRKIALTFDDCYWVGVINQLLEMVTPYPNFRLTFFAVGEAISTDEALSPGIWKRIYESGHEIGYHTMHHNDAYTMSASALIADFDEWIDVLHQVLGFTPAVHFAKPPYDDLSPSFMELCKERNLVATMFSIGYESDNLNDSMRFASRTQNGDIVQMHTYQDPAKGRLDVAITEKVLPYLAGQGFTLVTMSQLYDDYLREQNSSSGCDVGTGISLTRTCLE